MTDKGLRGLALMYIYHHTGAEAGAILFDNRGKCRVTFRLGGKLFLDIFPSVSFFGYVFLEAGLVFVVVST